MTKETRKRLLILAITTAVILAITARRPSWEASVGQIVPAPPAPLLVEVIEPRLWQHVTGWSADDGRFLLFMTQRAEPHTLRIERPGCTPYTAPDILFTAGRATTVTLPPCPQDTPRADPSRRARPSDPRDR